jgi:hypothetical protein
MAKMVPSDSTKILSSLLFPLLSIAPCVIVGFEGFSYYRLKE